VGLEFIRGKMETNIKVTELMEKEREKDRCIIMITLSILDNGNKVKSMEREFK